MTVDLAIAGGGPAGLAVAIRAVQAGFVALVLERSAGAPDKACGEGLMPAGVRSLQSLGALDGIPSDQRFPFAGIRYLQEDGDPVEARFSAGPGLGVRRTALVAALAARALSLGAQLRRCTVRGYLGLEAGESDGAGVLVQTDQGEVRARLLVAADGIHSPLRQSSGLARPTSEPRRYGLRRHFALAPWSSFVDVHWARGLECYVTPVGPALVNVAFLWEDEAIGEKASFESLLARFPRVGERLNGASVESEARGSGPLFRPVRARAADRVALVGDAAGYVDAITGQGLSLAFASASLLVEALPRPLELAALPAALRRYDRSLRFAWLRYALPARALLGLARRPRARHTALRLLARTPRLFGALLDAVAA
jgi:flavin-dependent dehydrogenase